MASTPIRTIRVSDEVWFEAIKLATAKGETVTDVLRRALIDYVTEADISTQPASPSW